MSNEEGELPDRGGGRLSEFGEDGTETEHSD